MGIHQTLRDLETPRVRDARGMNELSQGESVQQHRMSGDVFWGTEKTAKGAEEQAKGGE